MIAGVTWGALKLASSLVCAGFKKLVGADEDAAMIEWSGDVVLKAHDKSRQEQVAVSSTPSDMAVVSRFLEAQQQEVR